MRRSLISAACCSAPTFSALLAVAFQPPACSLPSLQLQRLGRPGRAPPSMRRRMRHLRSRDADPDVGRDEQPDRDRPITVVERCYGAWNRRDMTEAASCFGPADGSFEYDDGQYLGKVTTRRELERRFEAGASALPRGSVVVVDDLASCPRTGNIGARWHVEREDGSAVPLTRGCSFYTTDVEGGGGLIKTGFKVSEMVIKPDKMFADGVVASASGLMGAARGRSDRPEARPSSYAGATLSIIEQYYEAWNRRDMEGALECVSEDCLYETEDPLFVATLRGKDALRSHLVQNAASLPSSAQIILDDLAIDPTNGKIGARWHLEVGKVAVPNLRGCSMYTTDADTGLLRTGWDVTESPVKIPGPAMGILVLPAKLGLLR